MSDLAGRLTELGHEVRVLTALPNYPTGRVFQGYPRFHARETRDGIRVTRCWILPFHGLSLLRRLISYTSFALSSLIIGSVEGGPEDIVITESPPLFLAVAGWLLAAVKRARWILNVSDLWPESAKYIGMMKEEHMAYRALRALARWLYRKAWLVTGQSKEIVEQIAKETPEARVYHLSNGVDTGVFSPERFSQEVRTGYLKEGEVGFVYAGLHGLFQGLDQIIRVAQLLKGEPVRFLLFGDGPEKESLEMRARNLGLDNVDFYAPVPHGRMPDILASMDAALITLRSQIVGAVPSKIYEAMASGIPVLLVAGGEAARVVADNGCGLAVRPGDTDALAAAVRRLASDSEMRRRLGAVGRAVAQASFNRERIARDFEAVLCM